jgi:hypothetical protein
MPADEREPWSPSGQPWMLRLMLGLALVHGAGLAITVRRYLAAGSKWDRFVRELAVVGWLIAFVAIVAAFVGLRWIRRRARCFVSAVTVAAFAVGGGIALGNVRSCDTKDGQSLLRQVVGYTNVVEPSAVHVCAGQGRVRRPQWSSELRPRQLMSVARSWSSSKSTALLTWTLPRCSRPYSTRT